jgi:nucleoside-diphosphate-sugar epimerase
MPAAPKESPRDWSALHGSALRGRRVVVTGGCGFIGSHVATGLVALGADVTIFDDLSEGRDGNAPRSATIIRGSVLDREALNRALQGTEIVFHLAALVSVPRSVEEPLRYHDVNATGTQNVLEAARLAKVKRVVYSASSSAYGDAPTQPKVETMPPLPKSPYAATKLVGEEYIRAYASCYDGFDAASLRYFNIFGPRQRADSPYSGVIAKFASLLLSGQAPTITGDGSATRDFTYVENVVHANILAARAEKPLKGDTFNVATGVSTTVLTLATKMAELIGRPDLRAKFAPERPGDVLHSQADLSRSRSVLGYAPIVDFDEGLARTVEWYQSMR